MFTSWNIEGRGPNTEMRARTPRNRTSRHSLKSVLKVETVDVKQTQKVIPLITCEISFSQNETGKLEKSDRSLTKATKEESSHLEFQENETIVFFLISSLLFPDSLPSICIRFFFSPVSPSDCPNDLERDQGVKTAPHRTHIFLNAHANA